MKVRYDPTINLGHILTFLGFLISIFVAWNAMDKRIILLEAAQSTQIERDNSQDRERRLIQNHTNAAFGDIKEALKRIESKVDEK